MEKSSCVPTNPKHRSLPTRTATLLLVSSIFTSPWKCRTTTGILSSPASKQFIVGRSRKMCESRTRVYHNTAKTILIHLKQAPGYIKQLTVHTYPLQVHKVVRTRTGICEKRRVGEDGTLFLVCQYQRAGYLLRTLTIHHTVRKRGSHVWKL